MYYPCVVLRVSGYRFSFYTRSRPAQEIGPETGIVKKYKNHGTLHCTGMHTHMINRISALRLPRDTFFPFLPWPIRRHPQRRSRIRYTCGSRGRLFDVVFSGRLPATKNALFKSGLILNVQSIVCHTDETETPISEFWNRDLKTRLQLNHVPVHKTHSAKVIK